MSAYEALFANLRLDGHTCQYLLDSLRLSIVSRCGSYSHGFQRSRCKPVVVALRILDVFNLQCQELVETMSGLGRIHSPVHRFHGKCGACRNHGNLGWSVPILASINQITYVV